MEGFPCVLPTAQRDLMLLETTLDRWREDHLNWIERVIEEKTEPIPPLRLGEEYTELYSPSSSPYHRNLAARTTTVPNCSPPTECPHIGTLLARPLPPSFVSRIHDVVHITRELRVGADMNSQTYAGTLGSAGDPSSTPVVVKIYQCSMLPPAAWTGIHSWPAAPDPWFNPFQQFRPEYWAYQHLKPLQGTVVPHVYGFFKVCLPNGEPSIALVMEHVRRESKVARYIRSAKQADEDALDVVGCSILTALHAIQACGVGWEDLTSGNILFHSRRPANPVIIDFALVREVDHFYRDRQLKRLPQVLAEMGFGYDESVTWLKARLGELRWATLFDVPLGSE